MKTTSTLVVALSLVAGLLAVGCAPKEPVATPGKAETAALPLYKNDKGEMICPVTGEVIKSVKDATAYQDYKGKRYYFCCPMCPPKFKADPDKFAVRHETIPM